jgi:hypothetical protein
LDSNHIPSCTSAGSVLQLCKVSQNSNKPVRRSCTYKVHDPHFRESISWIKLGLPEKCLWCHFNWKERTWWILIQWTKPLFLYHPTNKIWGVYRNHPVRTLYLWPLNLPPLGASYNLTARKSVEICSFYYKKGHLWTAWVLFEYLCLSWLINTLYLVK